MARIDASMKEFSRALKETTIVCNSKGKWYRSSSVMRVVRRLLGLEGVRLARVGQAFNRCLDELEKIPVRFNASGALSPNQNVKFEDYLDTAKVLEEVLEGSRFRRAIKELNRLRYRVDALRYRLEKYKPGVVNKETARKVHELASAWKEPRIYFDEKHLTDHDIQLLDAACTYDHFAKRLLADTELRENFFDWTLKDRNNPDTFVQYPAMRGKLTECGLVPRIGFCGADALRIKKIPLKNSADTEKVLTLPFEGHEISILDEKRKVKFRGNYVLTIEEIFKVFYDRDKEIGNLEYFQDLGICNWNPKRFGWFNAKTNSYVSIDFEKDNWWEELPVLKEISKEEAKHRYKMDCNGSDWVISVKASREQPNLHPVGTHAYFEVAIPKNGKYRIFTFGKFAETFPKKWYEYINVLVNAVSAVISGPDENIFYTNRQHGGHSIIPTLKEAVDFMASIKRNILDSRQGNFVFQFMSNNCCKWVWKKARNHFGEKRIPDLFRISFVDVTPVGILGSIMSALRKMPHFIRWFFLTSLVIVLGGWRGMTVTKKNGRRKRISLLNSLPWSRGNKFFHPGLYFTKC